MGLTMQALAAVLGLAAVGAAAAAPAGALPRGGGGGALHHRRALQDSGSSGSQKPYDTCVCVFDFDETLRVIAPDRSDFDVPARDGQGIVRKCKEYGWEIGIASANDNYPKLHKVLGERVDNTTFTQAFFDSTAFQYHWYNKSISLDNIAQYYDTRPQCMMLFDDMEHNRKYAEALDVTFIKVRNDTGIRWADFIEGQKYMHQKCWCANPQDRSYSDFSRAPPDRNFAGRDRYGKPLLSGSSDDTSRSGSGGGGGGGSGTSGSGKPPSSEEQLETASDVVAAPPLAVAATPATAAAAVAATPAVPVIAAPAATMAPAPTPAWASVPTPESSAPADPAAAAAAAAAADPTLVTLGAVMPAAEPNTALLAGQPAVGSSWSTLSDTATATATAVPGAPAAVPATAVPVVESGSAGVPAVPPALGGAAAQGLLPAYGAPVAGAAAVGAGVGAGMGTTDPRVAAVPPLPGVGTAAPMQPVAGVVDMRQVQAQASKK